MKIRRWFEEKAAKARFMNSRYSGRCRGCGRTINVQDLILWVPLYWSAYCEKCAPDIQQHLREQV